MEDLKLWWKGIGAKVGWTGVGAKVARWTGRKVRFNNSPEERGRNLRRCWR